jgi:hypothetical protein
VSQLCVNTFPATMITLITDGIYFGSLRVKNLQWLHSCYLWTDRRIVKFLLKKAKKQHYKTKRHAPKRITAMTISVQTKWWAYREVVLEAEAVRCDSDAPDILFTEPSVRATFCETSYCGRDLPCHPVHPSPTVTTASRY